MDLEGQVAGIADVARALGPVWVTASDEELLAGGAAWAQVLRVAEARLAGFAAETLARSTIRAGEVGLAFRHGQRDGDHLTAHVARVSVTTARRWATIGAHLAPSVSLQGEVLPGRYPVLAAAVADGRVGLEAARWVAEALHSGRRPPPTGTLPRLERARTGEQPQDSATTSSRVSTGGDASSSPRPDSPAGVARQAR